MRRVTAWQAAPASAALVRIASSGAAWSSTRVALAKTTPIPASVFDAVRGRTWPGWFALVRTGWDRLLGRCDLLPPSLPLSATGQALADSGRASWPSTPSASTRRSMTVDAAHVVLLPAGILIAENLCCLEALRARSPYAFAFLPLSLGRRGRFAGARRCLGRGLRRSKVRSKTGTIGARCRLRAHRPGLVYVQVGSRGRARVGCGPNAGQPPPSAAGSRIPGWLNDGTTPSQRSGEGCVRSECRIRFRTHDRACRFIGGTAPGGRERRRRAGRTAERHARHVAVRSADACLDDEEVEFPGVDQRLPRRFGAVAAPVSASLSSAAAYHSVDMAANGYLDHALIDGTAVLQNMANFGYQGGTHGENIAAGMATAARGHANLAGQRRAQRQHAERSFGAIGIGRAYERGSPYGWYWTTIFGDVSDGPGWLCGCRRPGEQDAQSVPDGRRRHQRQRVNLRSGPGPDYSRS